MISTITTTNSRVGRILPKAMTNKRVESIDLLRGLVMIIMALDHTRDYFHNSAFLFNPEDLAQTNTILFLTRWVTHFCAPVFVLLAGCSAYLYGIKRSRKQLAFFLLTRGIWLVVAELFIISLFRTFNPTYHFFNLQVIWAIGISMIVLSGLIYLKQRYVLLVGIVLVATHNLLDNTHIPGSNALSIFWSFLHEPSYFTIGHSVFHIHYPVLPWIGIMAIGYCLGSLYARDYDPVSRKRILLILGLGAISLFVILRSGNLYGDAAVWATQRNAVYSILSFLNVTKYPPSLLYILITLGPALIFLSLTEQPLTLIKKKIAVFGRVPMFYYLAHILLIHFFAVAGAVLSGYKWSDMVLTSMVQRQPELKGYGFNLAIVYIIWIVLVLILYPLCTWFDRYKRANQSTKPWLSYL